MAESEEHSSITMTTAMLKVFANPLRRDMMRVFSKREFLRAADIAEALGQPANKISFHLRVMADAGLIIEAPEHARDGRDRVWTPIKESLDVGGPATSPEDAALTTAVLTALADDHIELTRRIVARSIAALGTGEGDDRSTFRMHNLNLTEAEYQDLLSKLSDVISQAQSAHDSSDPDGRAWQVDILAADATI